MAVHSEGLCVTRLAEQFWCPLVVQFLTAAGIAPTQPDLLCFGLVHAQVVQFLTAAAGIVTRKQPDLLCSGLVHMQVVQFWTNVTSINPDRLPYKLNSLLPHDIRVSWMSQTAPDFNVTVSAQHKVCPCCCSLNVTQLWPCLAEAAHGWSRVCLACVRSWLQDP